MPKCIGFAKCQPTEIWEKSRRRGAEIPYENENVPSHNRDGFAGPCPTLWLRVARAEALRLFPIMQVRYTGYGTPDSKAGLGDAEDFSCLLTPPAVPRWDSPASRDGQGAGWKIAR